MEEGVGLGRRERTGRGVREEDGGKRRDRGRKGVREKSVMWSVETSATLSLIVLLSQAAPEFTTSLEHEKHSKLNCEAVPC